MTGQIPKMEAFMAEAKQLREKMANIATEARSKLDEITDSTPEDRAAEIEREFDAMMADHDKVKAKAERMERAEAAQRAAEEIDYDRRPVGDEGSSRAVDDGDRMDYRTAFAHYITARSDSDIPEEARAVLAEHRVQTVGTTTAGGHTVPTELATFIEKAMIATGPMYGEGLFTVINSADGRPFDIPTVDDTAVTAEAYTEGGTGTDDGGKDVTFGKKTLNAFPFDSEWVRWSAELNVDSVFNMEALLGDLIGERLGRIANSKLTTGSGSSDVEGIVTNAAAATAAASTSAITADEIIDFMHSVDPAYRTAPRAAFMMNDGTLAAVRKLKDGDGNYLWQMGNFQAGVPDRLLGYPVAVNQAMAGLGDGVSSKVMLFGDMSKFYVRKVGAPSIYVARERFAPSLGILGYIRFDGVLTNTAAIKHLPLAAS